MGNSYEPEYKNSPKRIKLKGLGYLGHYAFVLLILLPFLLSVVQYIKFLTGTYHGVRPIEELFHGTWFFILLALLLFIIQFQRLKFKSVETSLSSDKVIILCNKYAEANDLKIKHVSQNEFVAVSTRSVFFELGEWGEMLTVIIQGHKAYINCICDPYNRPNMISMGRNKKYERELIQLIKNASA